MVVFNLRDPLAPNYEKQRRRLEGGPSGINKKGRGKIFPPTPYHGHDQKGHQHPARTVVWEPGMQILCPDCGNEHKTTDHFKYSCECWCARTRLACGFAQLKAYNLLTESHYLSNETIDVMRSRGVTFERVNNQHPDWLPHEPLYERHALTGKWTSTGIVPLNIYRNLPAELRQDPVPQNLSVEARNQMGLDGRNITTLVSPRHTNDRELDRHLRIMENAWAEQRNWVLPNYQKLMAENEEYKARIERLEMQIAVCKFALDKVWYCRDMRSDACKYVLESFDNKHHPDYIDFADKYVRPEVPVPKMPETKAHAASSADIAILESIPAFDKDL